MALPWPVICPVEVDVCWAVAVGLLGFLSRLKRVRWGLEGLNMTLESMLAALSPSEKLAAMDILWRDLSANPADLTSPDWHGNVLDARLAEPSAKPRLPLDAAIEDVRGRLNAQSNSGMKPGMTWLKAHRFTDANHLGRIITSLNASVKTCGIWKPHLAFTKRTGDSKENYPDDFHLRSTTC